MSPRAAERSEAGAEDENLHQRSSYLIHQLGLTVVVLEVQGRSPVDGLV